MDPSFSFVKALDFMESKLKRRVMRVLNMDLIDATRMDILDDVDPLVEAVNEVRKAHGLPTGEPSSFNGTLPTQDISLKEFSGTFDVSWKMLRDAVPSIPKGRKYRKFANYER